MAVATALSLAGAAQAALVDRGGDMVFDTDRNITWLADANYAKTTGFDADGRMTWDVAKAWASSLTVGGATGWRLPTTIQPDYSCEVTINGNVSVGTGCVGGEMGHLFYDEFGALANKPYYLGTNTTNIALFSNIQGLSVDPGYWTNTPLIPSAENGMEFLFGWGVQGYQHGSHSRNAFAVHDGDVGCSPFPGGGNTGGCFPGPGPFPAPEPSTYALMLAGLSAMGIAARRRKTSSR